MSVESVLYDSPWIDYNDTLLRSRLVLTWPKNMIFTAQLLDCVSSLDVYNNYPYAERMDATTLQNVDWENSLIVIDSESQIVLAPEPVRRLVQLDGRLRFTKAANQIFGPFRILPSFLQLFDRIWLYVLLFMIAIVLSIEKLYKFRQNRFRLVLTSKPLPVPIESDQ